MIGTEQGAPQGVAAPEVSCCLYPDGFNMAMELRCLPAYFAPPALERLDFLRRAACGYRHRILTFPLDSATAVAANDTDIYVARAVIGSWIWGYQFRASGSEQDFSVMITDVCGEREIFKRWVTGTGMEAFTGTNMLPYLLSTPHLVKPPGQIKGQIRNNSGTARAANFLLHMAEPCVGVRGE